MFEVYCIGSAHPDNIFTFVRPSKVGHTSPATCKQSIGGVAYNIALTLKALGSTVAMAGILGRDYNAEQVIKSMQQSNIDSSAMLRTADYNTASYTAFHEPDGEMRQAAIDVEIYDRFNLQMLSPIVEQIKQTRNWVIDSVFEVSVMNFLRDTALKSKINVYLIIASIYEAEKLIPGLKGAKALFGNLEEMQHLVLRIAELRNDSKIVEYLKQYNVKEKISEEHIWYLLECLAAQGVENVFATHGANGVYVLANGNTIRYTALPVDKVVCVNGAGDNFAAAVIFKMMQNCMIEDAISAGLVAASLRISGRQDQIPNKLANEPRERQALRSV